ncbi:unnamed protein product, partial [Heterosigma akashiwo]
IGVLGISPETLRRAKMNAQDEEVVLRLWSGMYRLCVLAAAGFPLLYAEEDNAQVGGAKVKAHALPPFDQTAACAVIAGLRVRGYSSWQSLACWADAGPQGFDGLWRWAPSLDLFLAFCFLLANDNVFEAYWDGRTQALSRAA